MKKAIFIDLDGTLLKGLNPNSISKKNKEYLRKLQQQGVYVVICTGRSRKQAIKAQNNIKHNDFGDYIIYSGGAVLENVKCGKIIEQNTLNKEEIKSLVQEAQDYDFALKVDGIDAFFADSPNKYKLISKILKMKVKKWESFILPSKSNKISLLSLKNPTENEKIRNEILTRNKSIDLHLSGKGHYLEATPKGKNKGSTIKTMCKHLGIDLKNTVGVGDSMNDYEMFKVVNTSIAMKNSSKQLKEVADYQTTHHKQSGVANIEKYIKWLNS